MSDRSAARAYGHSFTVLAMNASQAAKTIALKLAKEISVMGKDFSLYQMDADASLVKLGLAKYNKEGTEDYIQWGEYRYFF